MKKIIYLFCIISVSPIFSQTLPINFESDVVTEDFINFDGGTVTVVANPQSSAINTSATVAQLVRNGGQVWAGSKIDLTDNLDFSSLNSISMKFYTAAPIGTAVKFKLEGADGANFEVDQFTTVSSEWETLTFDFTGQPAVFYSLVFIFDLNNLGDGSDNSTFYFDDLQQIDNSVVTELADLSLPLDFESVITTEHFINFDGGTGSVVENPNVSGLNLSTSVGKIVRNGGAIWAGSKLELANNLDFSDLGAISMSVLSSAPAGTAVKLKLEGADGAAFEVDQLTTISGEWETLTFDFTGQPAIFYYLVLIFDFGNLGDGSESSTFYFDGINQNDDLGGDPTLSQIDFPVDFEDATVNYTMTDFGGASSSLVEDPEDASNHVIQSIKTSGAETWAGTTIGTETGFATYLPLTLEDSKMSIRVWSPQAGIPVRLKVEDSNDVTHTCETETNTTVANAWDTLVFDFANEAPGTQSLEVGLGMGWAYNEAAIFFDFGSEGNEATYYFDDVEFGVSTTIGIYDRTVSQLVAYPNPTLDKWTFESDNQIIQEISIYDVLGNRVYVSQPNASIFEVNAFSWKAGIYMSQIKVNNKTIHDVLLKK